MCVCALLCVCVWCSHLFILCLVVLQTLAFVITLVASHKNRYAANMKTDQQLVLMLRRSPPTRALEVPSNP